MPAQTISTRQRDLQLNLDNKFCKIYYGYLAKAFKVLVFNLFSRK